MRARKLLTTLGRARVVAALAVMLVTLANVTSYAQAQANSIRFERISLQEGLSEAAVNAILQDRRGFMWFGTRDGLNKYDGYDFTIYRHDPQNPDSLSDSFITSLYEDRAGVLWIGTYDGGLNRFNRDSGTFTRYQHDPGEPASLSHNRVWSIYEDRAGELWVGTYDGGLNRFDRDTESFTHYRHDPQDPRTLSSDVILTILDPSQSAGTLWVGTTGGLSAFDRTTETFTHYRHDPDDPHSLSHDVVLSLYEDRGGGLWVGTSAGLNKFDRATESFTRYQHDPHNPYSLSGDSVTSICEDQGGALWIGTYGTEGGLDKFDPVAGTFVHYVHDDGDPHSLSSNDVRAIYEDRGGVLWIGTHGGGLSKLNRATETFVHFRHDPDDANSLSHNYVTSLYKDRSGMLWIGTRGGGLNRYDRITGTFTHYQHNPLDPYSLSSNTIWALYEDRNGVLWFGTEGGGLDLFNPSSESFTHWLGNNTVRAIYEDSAGMFWVGTHAGLFGIDVTTGTSVYYEHDPQDSHTLSDQTVLSIYEDQAGVLWIGTGGGGLNRYDRATETFTAYSHQPDLPGSLTYGAVTAICEDLAGALWVATTSGLNRFDRATETFVHYTEKDGLANVWIHGMVLDDEGYLWLSTNGGLSRVDPRTESFKNFDTSDGLQSNGFNTGAYHKARQGELFFGGVNGFNAFYPGQIKVNSHVPPIVITAFKKFGRTIRTDIAESDEIVLSYRDNFISFEFAALDYAAPEKNQYAYKLEGFDQDWIDAGTRRYKSYTNLRGGDYVFRVKGSNNDGVWNEEGIAVRIVVQPPVWETWWFQGLLFLGLVGSVIGAHRLRVRSIAARNRELEDQVEERTHALEQRTREIERRRQELEALYRADAELHRHLRLDEVLQALVDIAVDILQADKSSLLDWDDRRERLVVHVARGFKPETLAQLSFAPGEGTVGHVAATGEPVIVEDARTDSRIARQLPLADLEGIRSFMQVPIKVGGEVFGVFSADYVQPHAFGGDEQRLFMALAQRAALAIDTAQLYEQSQELVVVEERNRLARDLHDAVTQTLFSASLIAEALPTLWENDQQEGRQLLKELQQLSRGALAEMRTLLMELRPAALAETSLDDLLRQLAEAVTGRTGIPVTIKVADQCNLSSDVHVALYRIAQEALNNAVKHAHASQVTVGLRCGLSACGGEEVELCVSDDGRGFDLDSVSPDHLGLGIMHERAQAIGATIRVESRPGHGTQVIVVWQEG